MTSCSIKVDVGYEILAKLEVQENHSIPSFAQSVWKDGTFLYVYFLLRFFPEISPSAASVELNRGQ